MPPSLDKQKKAPQEHGPVGPAAMHHHPKAVVGQNFGLCGCNGYQHDYERRNTSHPCQKAKQDQGAT